jgi:6-phosphogluconate dehydrogenase
MSGLCQIGIVGLGVMGKNLALNLEEKGFPVAVYDYYTDRVESFANEVGDRRIIACKSPEALVKALERPRRILIMVKAGAPVDDVIKMLLPSLERDDILIDGGNEHFITTRRRGAELEPRGLHFIGMGVSGGEEGARHGPSLMPGGPRTAYDALAPMLRKIAAQVRGVPCVDYMGPDGAGHYVKMVHNGIEYGDMQLIAEAYDLLHQLGGLDNAALSDVFDEWNRGELESYLVEVTARIFRKVDPLGSGALIDAVLDQSGMKGTGKWTVQEAAELGEPVPTIASALDARLLSAMKAERVAAAKRLPGPTPKPVVSTDDERRALIAEVRQALYAAKICSYAQGLHLLRTASITHGWDLQLGHIARIWRGGCIIRARFLDRIDAAYERDPTLTNLLLDPEFTAELAARQTAWRQIIGRAVSAGLGVPAFGASLAYYDDYRRERLPANLIQAQRDLFGAHTYQRLDREGTFHTEWSS